MVYIQAAFPYVYANLIDEKVRECVKDKKNFTIYIGRLYTKDKKNFTIYIGRLYTKEYSYEHAYVTLS
jgi:hypothetical protein